MNLFKVYLQKDSTQRVLRRGINEKGFSLIELVVVIAVLAVLTAIALPNFLGVTDDASARTAQQAVLNGYKECKVFWARNKKDGVGSGTLVQREFARPAVPDWTFVMLNKAGTPRGGWNTARTYAGTAQFDNEADNDEMACFTAGENDRDIYAVPKDITKFPTYKIATDGYKYCRNGTDAVTYKETFDVGCDGSGADGVGEWE